MSVVPRTEKCVDKNEAQYVVSPCKTTDLPFLHQQRVVVARMFYILFVALVLH